MGLGRKGEKREKVGGQVWGEVVGNWNRDSWKESPA
jgi:hypothetical protein